MTVREHLELVRSHLQVPAAQRDRVLAEISDHLWSAVEALVSEGIAQDVAEQTAVERFGPAASIARMFVQVLRKETSPMQSVVAALNVLTAVVAVGGSLIYSSPHVVAAWLLVAAIVVVAGGLAVRPRGAAPILLAGVTLVALGTAGTIWTVAAYLIHGDATYWATCFAMGYAAQGLLMAWVALERARTQALVDVG